MALIRPVGVLGRSVGHFRDYYGRYLPDDDAGRDDLEIVAHHIVELGGDVKGHIIAWAAAWMPALPRAEAEALADRVIANPRRFKASTLGWRLRLTETKRREHHITTIRAFGVSDTEMAERDREKRRDRAAKRRTRKRAAKPPRSAPLRVTQPWTACGMSKATWYRKGKPSPETRETNRVPSRETAYAGHAFLSHATDRQPAQPAPQPASLRFWAKEGSRSWLDQGSNLTTTPCRGIRFAAATALPRPLKPARAIR
jgi:hypothetical protein